MGLISFFCFLGGRFDGCWRGVNGECGGGWTDGKSLFCAGLEVVMEGWGGGWRKVGGREKKEEGQYQTEGRCMRCHQRN